MSWMVAIWGAALGICLVLAAIQFFIWFKWPEDRAHLLFGIVCVAIGVLALFEMLAMKADSTAQYALLHRWGSAWVLVLMLCVVALVRVTLGGARSWPALVLSTLIAWSLVLNFASPVSITALEIASLVQLQLWGGDTVAVPVIVPNPWRRLHEFSILLYFAYILATSVSHWRRSDEVARRRAMLIGGSILLATLAAAIHGQLLDYGLILSPYIITPSCLVLLMGIGYELGAEVLQAERLARMLKERDVELLTDKLASAERFRLMVEASPNVKLMVNQAGRVILTNVQAEKVFGYSREELLNISLDALVKEAPRADREPLQERLFEGNASGEPIDGIFSGRRKDGSEFPLEMRFVTITLDHGVFVLATADDISERKRAENEITQQRTELAHMSRVMMLSELSGSLAHELNQPLAAILSNAQAAQRFLSEDAPNLDELREILQDIVSDDRRAGEIIRGLRTLLKKGELDNAPVGVNELVQDVLKLARSDLMNGGVDLQVKFDPALPGIFGDRVQLQQVLLNLVMNGCEAMAHTAAPERRLLVSTALNPGEGVQICVVDRGHGIPQAQLERVFEPFVTSKAGGLGLGLAVCRRIVGAHGGRLWAEHNAEGGATFCLMLPVKSGGAS